MLTENKMSADHPQEFGKLKGAIAELLRTDRFYLGLLVSTEIILSDLNDTAWTDGFRIGFSPQFVANHDRKLLAAVMAHECDHVLSLHPFRIKDRDRSLWNVATDYVINRYLTQRGYTLPKDCLFPPEDHDWNAERWYRWLLDNPDKQPKTPQNVIIVFDDLFPPDGDGDGDGDQNGKGKGKSKKGLIGKPIDADTEKKIKERAKMIKEIAKVSKELADAHNKTMGKNAGAGSADQNRAIGDLIDPRINWIEETSDFLRAISRVDYSWKRFSDQYLNRGFYLPKLSVERIAPIVFAVDTSGSMDINALKKAGGAYESMRPILNPEMTYVVYCDYSVNGVEEIGDFDPVEFNPVGGGGTRFSPVFEWIEKQDFDQIAGLIYFTDLHCSDYPQSEPEFPVLWVTDNQHFKAPPFGRVTVINDH